MHIARLRQLLHCVKLAIPEIWALAHWDGTWLTEVRQSLAWLLPWVDPAATDWTKWWPSWRVMMLDHPGRWKSLLRKAQSKATRAEVWEATRQYCTGLASVATRSWWSASQSDTGRLRWSTLLCSLLPSV